MSDIVQTNNAAANVIKSSIFITEDDRFEIRFKYLPSLKNMWVEGLDEDSGNLGDLSEFIASFKYPSQGDYKAIVSNKKEKTQQESVTMEELGSLELARIVVLIRSWNLPAPVTFENILKLPTKIVKGMILKIRYAIGFDGII